jgi:hypothetical protein
MYSSLRALLKRKNQRFVCTNGGWPSGIREEFVAQLCHDVTPALDDRALAAVAKQTGDIPQLLEFYRHWGSARLYRDTIPKWFESQMYYAAAFYIAPPQEWAYQRMAFQDWLANLSADEERELLPDWINAYVVIGEIPNSGNSLLVPLEGVDKGKVFEFEHDGFEFIERGKDFAEFVDWLCTVDEELLGDISCHTCYTDGTTEAQWMCRAYLFDAND